MNIQEVMDRARRAKNPEELLALARELNMEVTAAEAEETFAMLHKKGELSDQELENTAGGGCDTTVNGKNYTVVSAGTSCFTWQYTPNYLFDEFGVPTDGPLYTTDHKSLRDTWQYFAAHECCGRCRWLGFKGGIGYCTKES